jgi:hypothetical protein
VVMGKITNPTTPDWLEDFIETYVVDRHTCEMGLLPCTYCEAKQAITTHIQALLDDIEQSIKSHTVPEGKNLLNRQYVLNTIEFVRKKEGL